ncbi:membrane proteins related to metalloendopeptidases [Desulfocucumis palustris]|uniref:Membrane proteins related to metalloendopeptidases n=1 Tax=Desulfocucumis palustris TaxID=1898651 RepID=A0A2L2XGV5_9FIRM|nr:M23 family metallopeptidase [Desulfocucumis palustris]GBF35468.1 membrane proteins related to metalloendopeptidases [Desulfocucumis palustris]
MEQDKSAQNLTRAGVGGLARSGFKISGKILSAAVKQLLFSLAPIALPLLGMLLLFFIIFTILFLLPKFMMDNKPPNGESKVVSIFNLGEKDDWTEARDMELAQKYRELSDRTWKEGHQSTEELKESLPAIFDSDIEKGRIASQQTQAYPHRLPWSVLAGVDRVAGDPIIHKDGLLRNPNPDYHYEVLKSSYQWTTFKVTKVDRTIERDKNGNKTVSYHTYTGQVYLLDTANNFEGGYKYIWETETNYYDDGHLKSIMPKLVSVEKSGPFLKRLIDLMAGYKVTDRLEIETVLELAELYDEEYQIDAGIMGNRVEAFQVDLTKQYYTGERGTVCLPVPAKYFTITSPFGKRIHPITKTEKPHNGIDIGAPSGAPVYSAWEGVVMWAGKKGGYGNCVMIDHGDVKTLYGHLSLITVAKDAHVKGGDKIGLVGSTGLSTGPHLHFEVFKVEGGTVKYEDPMRYIN